MQCGCEECYGDGGKEYRTAENGARRKSWEKRARVEAAWRILLPYFKDVQDRAVSFREVWAVRRILTVNLPDAKERCAETALHAFLICTAVAALLLSVRRGFSDGPLSAGFRRRERFPLPGRFTEIRKYDILTSQPHVMRRGYDGFRGFAARRR